MVHHYGDWRQVQLKEITTPRPASGEVLIQTEAASLNFADLLMIEGKYQHKPVVPFVPGRDVGGRIV